MDLGGAGQKNPKIFDHLTVTHQWRQNIGFEDWKGPSWRSSFDHGSRLCRSKTKIFGPWPCKNGAKTQVGPGNEKRQSWVHGQKQRTLKFEAILIRTVKSCRSTGWVGVRIMIWFALGHHSKTRFVIFLWSSTLRTGHRKDWRKIGPVNTHQHLDIQWNLGIRDTQGTVRNCPEF